ncbi:adenylate/guanylate cyclase domain-containing protein [Flavobacterium subsaxonicum]|uniref:adenylate/guanylate cyclase domain-containing protein n=1 Tax=Flavobacterium subsaxonicum TaxID=426226 RepID=UPI0006867E95|nr:adenylate/guanylate cyclase domain-containing protein [Flavobacterium subsaxonicum]
MALSKHRVKHYILEIFYITVSWIMGGLLFVFVKFNDLPDSFIHKIYPVEPWMNKVTMYGFSIASCTVVGLIMGLLHTLAYPRLIRTRNILLSIGLRLLVFIVITLTIIAIFFHQSGLSIPQNNQGALQSSATDVFIYLTFIEMMVGVVVTLRRNLGSNYFRNFVRNAYFTPTIENRVFMFIDLKNSTQAVEKMGNTAFSSFIQDCFKDLSSVALDLGGEVYQFVGDEAVLTWMVKPGFNFEDCLLLHYKLAERLAKKKGIYLEKHGTFPAFRSSVHCGAVSAAMVGEYKKEIAYHGGVLNLCARLQVVCRDYNADLVVSEDFHKAAALTENFKFYPIADITLKGIANKQLAYNVAQL